MAVLPLSNVRRAACLSYGNAVECRGAYRRRNPVFIRYAAEVWSDAEREEFINFIAANPEAGKLIRGSGGCRKVRWSSKGQGKQGGVRVIYFLTAEDMIWLLDRLQESEV